MCKVLFATHTYYPDNNGVQVVNQYIAEGLVKKGYDVSVITQFSGRNRPNIYNGVKIYEVKVKGRKHHIYYGDRKQYEKCVREIDPDVFVVVCVQCWTFDWANRFLKKLNCVTILHTHGFYDYKKKYHIINSIGSGQIRKAAGDVLSYMYYLNCPRYMKKYNVVTYLSPNETSYRYACYKGILKNAEILGNAVEDAFWNICPISHKKNELMILCVANYSEIKNQEKIIEAFYKLPCNNCHLVLVGSEKNDYYFMLCELKEKLSDSGNNKRVDLLTNLSRKEIFKLYSSADLYVMASKWEAFSISLCEAAASGIPIISTNVGNAAEFKGIVLVHVNDLAEKMKLLIDNFELRQKYSKQLRKYAEENFKREEKVLWYDRKIKELLNNENNK